jgi:enoyl-CoA hydratase
MGDFVTVDQSEHVATVSLVQPTMPPAFFDEIGETFRSLADDPDLRAVVLQSNAKAFSYGLDLNKAVQEHGPLLIGGGLAKPRTDLLRLIKGWQGCLSAVAELPVPVVAAIHGWCIGGGLDLISACDLRLASADAQFSLRETRIAIVADLGSLQRLPHIIGEAQTRELAFTGRDFDAEHAHRIGLVNHVHPNRDEAVVAAQELAQEIARNPPLTVRGVKQVLNHRTQSTVDQGLDYVATWNSAFLQSEDLGEAMAAFMERRDPRFSGR